MVKIQNVTKTQTKLWCMVIVMVMLVLEVAALNGPNVCTVQQKYNITKRVKYRAPMSVRTYEWCFAVPPRCSKWKTEMRELTKLETDERIAEVAVCCPGYKMKEVSCVPVCPNGKTGHRCSDDCPQNKWGPNCVNDCEPCNSGTCSPITGDCSCQEGWQGESCEIRMLPSTSTTTAENLLTNAATKPTPPSIPSTRAPIVTTTSLATTQSSRSTETSSRTTLIEYTTQQSRLRTIIESSVLNITSLIEPPPVPSNSTLLKTNITTTTLKPSTTVITTPIPMTPLDGTSTTEGVLPPTSLVNPPREIVSKTDVETTVKTITSIPRTEDGIQITKFAPIATTLATIQLRENTNKVDDVIPTPTIVLPAIIQNNFTSSTTEVEDIIPLEHTTKTMITDFIENRTEVTILPRKTLHEQKVPVRVITGTNNNVEGRQVDKTTQKPTIAFNNITDEPFTAIKYLTTSDRTSQIRTTRRPESTIRYFPTTVKFKPKEIWIRPAQKGELFMKAKTETSQDSLLKPKVVTNTPNTTPKTIIVSIIPTSVSYVTFKKVALTTALSFKNLTVTSPNGTAERDVTKPMSTLTITESPSTTKLSNLGKKSIITSKLNKTTGLHTSKSETHIDKTTLSTFHTTREFSKNKTVSKDGTNSMKTVERNLNSSNLLTTPSTNAIRTTHLSNITDQPPKTITKPDIVTKHPFIKIDTVKRNVTIITVSGKNKNETIVKITKTIAKDVEKTNATRTNGLTKTNSVTESPEDEEKFHILTEPEHITAVMEGKGKERTSVDLISVISIAGGIMMAVITVAVIIVMVERCKRPRYDNARKVSDIRMQVMIENNDVPPPYLRSIFHTPLPDPPASEKCHYQPISTLDRNLKQFMRPVVVQSISPIMLENFRGILECHYDHLPRRSHNFETIQRHCQIAPSVDEADELTRLRTCSAMDSTIDALKCEARLDVIDSTTSEPLYAEIPCWRPPSEHAVEIMNLNGEAVTEL